MEKISPQNWANSTGINPAGQVFVARWLELFHRLTIDTYRVRHLNLRLGFEELSAAISDVEALGMEPLNVKDVSSEVLRLLKEDPVAQELLPQRQHYYAALLQPLLDDKRVHPGLRVLVDEIRTVLVRKYRSQLLTSLRQAIVANEIERTVRITGALASDLIGEGYDLRHLYWRGEYFKKTPVRPFLSKLDELLNRFEKVEHVKYTVVFRLVLNREQDADLLPASILRLGLKKEIPNLSHQRAINFVKLDARFRYGVVEVQATDPFAASRGGGGELSSALDLLRFAHPSTVIEFPSASLIMWGLDALTVPMGLELLGPMRIAHEEVEARVRQVGDIARDGRITPATRDRLVSGLRYLRRGLSDTTAHGQFSNFWIGLESIAGGIGRTVVRNLRDRVARLVALGYPRRIMSDLRANLERLGISVPGNVGAAIFQVGGNRSAELVALWQAVIDQATRANVLLPAAAGYPLLQQRIEAVGAITNTADQVRQSVERCAEDVSWHVQRMYRIRNAIVHGGYTPGDVTHVSSHLATYLWAILRVLIEELARPDGIADIERILDKYSWLYETELKQLREGTLNLPALVEPTSIWPH